MPALLGSSPDIPALVLLRETCSVVPQLSRSLGSNSLGIEYLLPNVHPPKARTQRLDGKLVQRLVLKCHQ